MKKSHIYMLFLSFAVCFSLTACSSKSSQSTKENSPSNSVTAASIQKTEESDELSERLKQYKAFLQEEISSETKSDGSLFLRDFCNIAVPEKAGAEISYALFDMTGDGLPELHVLTDISYSVHTIQDNQLVTWYEGDRHCRPLNNGVILEKIESTGIHYGYYFLDDKGEMYLCVGFSCPPKGAKKGIDKYYFGTGGADAPDDYDDIEVSKKKWKELTKPFLAMSSDKIIWKHITDLLFIEKENVW